MFIEYLGHSSFLIKGEKFRVVTDPFDEIGYEMPHVKAEYVTISHGHYDHCNAMAVDGVEEVFTEPFSYMDGTVQGLSCFHDDKKGKLRGKNTVFKMNIDGVTVTHMGDVGERPTPALLDFLKGTDVLLIPVGGVYTIDAAGAKEYVDKVMPKIVIPMHYNDEFCSIRLEPLQKFTALFPQEKVEFKEGKYEADLSGNGKVVVLKRRGLVE